MANRDAWTETSGYLAAVPKRGLPLYGASLARLSPVVPADAVACYFEHESAFVRWAKAGDFDAGQRFVELGFGMLVLSRTGRDEVRGANVDPLDPDAATWGVQWAFDQARRQVDADLRAIGWPAFELLDVVDQVALLMACRAIGRRCLAGIMRRAWSIQGARYAGPVGASIAWLARPASDCGPFCGVQAHAIVAWRVSRAACVAYRARELAIVAWPATLPPLGPRPADLAPAPRDLRTQLPYYIARARAQGDKPTGPWPTGRA